MERRGDRFAKVGDRYANYTVYDQNNEKIGKVDDLFVDESDRPEYIGVKTGFFGLNSTLIPFSLARVDEERQLIEVATDKDAITNAPNFDDDTDITPEFEQQVYSHFGLQQTSTGDLDDRNELRIQRSEEELRAGTRERQAGAVNVRKRVRVDRERIEVPTRREEISVERVPVSDDAYGTEIGEGEVVIPLVEEEVIVSKRAVIREEIRLRKDVVEETQVVEDEVRREEIDIEDSTTRPIDADI